jgi:hypothetical protein
MEKDMMMFVDAGGFDDQFAVRLSPAGGKS